MAHPVVVEQSRAIPVTVSDAFAKTLPMPLPALFNRWYGPIPPIKAVHDQTGDWSTVGETRTIALAGGGGMRETLTRVDAPDAFGYTLSDVRGAMAPLIDHIEGRWEFSPHGTGTKVTWRWTLYPKSALSAPALPVFARIWRGYAKQALETLSDHVLG
ncbi:SRPBCC family protein [Mycobacterium sp. CVI_P3]|uniref:SRPBCC family protein n=1 Tax=Mycobacterium pinniadriaticum TaxID=2994102 RepID=A0ABT3SIT0_9MYCO|nr:SRPBCC family protein [Mycobacterium pinniadriaticum]MCX2933018.1 SRPBCC family protein [Mycobacterium pinniadriaticum]MCX2939440.1 SRPBCC family protein [Mycobacterium pinniadriaticum]